MLAYEQEKAICEEEYFLSGPELLHYRLVPYRGKLKSVAGTENATRNAFILIDVKGKQDICRVPVNILEDGKRIYIAEGNFNRYWKNICYLIYTALKKEKEMKQDFYALQKEMEAYVDLSAYVTEYRKAVIENFQIKIEGIQLPAEIQRLRSRRASAMDNKKLVYVFSQENDVVHDKSCPRIKSIADIDFRASGELPEGKVLCPECKKRMYIRKGCGDDFKRYDAYSYFFKKGHVDTETIGVLTGTYQAKIRLEGVDELTVACGEDTWKLVPGERNHIILWHNNYTMINDTERYICGGFHRQNVPEHISMTGAIRYLESYTWEKHLLARKNNVGQENVPEMEREENQNTGLGKEAVQKELCAKEEAGQSRQRLQVLWIKGKQWLERIFRRTKE